ncbi:hypothetical protein AB0F72_14440 [Actinoplanes sp. NPDC023936]|uniref:hypothetical protein n=1 Tax=Actinoplanes sp. NPDC023936 TaxID=3154910 RepID=UPI0034014E8D
MSETKTRIRSWASYLLAVFAVQLVLHLLVRTEQFGDGPLEHSFVRVGIGLVVAPIIVVAASSLSRSIRVKSQS